MRILCSLSRSYLLFSVLFFFCFIATVLWHRELLARWTLNRFITWFLMSLAERRQMTIALGHWRTCQYSLSESSRVILLCCVYFLTWHQTYQKLSLALQEIKAAAARENKYNSLFRVVSFYAFSLARSFWHKIKKRSRFFRPPHIIAFIIIMLAHKERASEQRERETET